MEERVFTREELAGYDGKEGRPAYVAFQNKVYDLSSTALWDEGDHFGEHDAGSELTEELERVAPHGPEVLEAFPTVGTLGE